MDDSAMEIVEFKPKLWKRIVSCVMLMLFCVYTFLGAFSSDVVSEWLYGPATIAMFWLVMPYVPDLIAYSICFLLDDAPTLIVGKRGFAYRVGYHVFGVFRWDQVVEVRRWSVCGVRFFNVTIADRRRVRQRPNWPSDLLRFLRLDEVVEWVRPKPKHGRIQISNLIAGGRLDEVEALFQKYVGDRDLS